MVPWAHVDDVVGVYYRGQLLSSADTLSSELKSAKQLEIELRDIAEHGVRYATVFQGQGNRLKLSGASALAEMRSLSTMATFLDISWSRAFCGLAPPAPGAACSRSRIRLPPHPICECHFWGEEMLLLVSRFVVVF